MNGTIKISVIVTTYNRSDILPETLGCLARQTLDRSLFEVIVVDDESPDHTRQLVESMIKTSPYRLSYTRHANSGPGYSQNQGIRMAKGEIIVLIADDILLEPQALEKYLEDHRQNPGQNVVVLGKVTQSPKLAEKSVFLKHWDPFKFRKLEKLRELPYYLFWACNISFKREFMLKYGMFRQEKGRAGYAAHEDAELGYRLSLHGMILLYNKEAAGCHYHIAGLETAIRQATIRGLNWGEFRSLVKSPDITVRYHILNRHTLKDHMEAFRTPNSLIGSDKNIALLMVRQVIRMILFNVITVPCLWLPLMAGAEKHKGLACLMHRDFYRGVIAYHFFKAVKTGYKLYPEDSCQKDAA